MHRPQREPLGRHWPLLPFCKYPSKLSLVYPIVHLLFVDIPTYFGGNRRKIAFNERLRFLRYKSGEFFAPHYDGAYYQRETGEISKITFLLYLNDEFKGGQTKLLHPFDCENTWHAPKIEAGMVLMFEHETFHEGCPLDAGTKYIVRTDVMYSKKVYDKKERAEDKKNIPIKYTKYDGFEQDKDDEKSF